MKTKCWHTLLDNENSHKLTTFIPAPFQYEREVFVIGPGK